MEELVVDHKLQFEITRFYYLEASLLDHRKYEDWLNLLTNDIVYRMPLRVTCDKKDGGDIVNEMTFFEEDIKSLAMRVRRLTTASAWSDDPAPRTRHFISNVFIEPMDKENELRFQCCFMLTRNRGDNPVNEQITGERIDVIRKTEGVWKISSRTIHPDQAVLGTLHLNSFL